MKKLYVGNLAFGTTEDSLRAAFAAYGTVLSSVIIQDRETGRSRGFGFIEMENANEAEEAIAQMNGAEFEGRSLTVNEARPPVERGGGGGGGRRPQRW